MRSTLQHIFPWLFTQKPGSHIGNRHKFQSETQYLALHDCELRRTQEYHCLPESLTSPCHAMLNTARDSTRFVARLSFSTVISREKKGHGGRACRLTLSGRIGSSLGIPSIQLSRTTRGLFCPLTSTGKKIGISISKMKKYLYFAVSDRKDSLPPKNGIACCELLCLYVFFFFCNYKYSFFCYIHIVGSW